jgi:protein-tyrosine phosphatase
MTTIEVQDGRVLRFDGIHNFRDYGGYATADGGRLVSGKLFRSAQHKDASAADLGRLAELGFAAVIDLRNDQERATSPCRRPEGFSARVLFAPDAAAQAAPHIEAAQTVSDPDSAVARMIAGYASMPFRPAFMQTMRHYFEALGEVEGPTLIHCMAGKDRTGMAVAVLHRAMGVDREDWLADYMMTNVTGNIDARIAAGATHVRAAFGKDLDDATVRALMTARPSYIDSCFDAMAERYGGLDGYLDACGIDGTMIARVRERLVA